MTKAQNVTISAIVAIGKRGQIGLNGDLPWRLPSDLKYFKKTTLHSSIVMGRKTFESIGERTLPDRVNFILTSQKQQQNQKEKCDAVFCSSIEEVLEKNESENLFICGGSALYQSTCTLLDFLYLTRVDYDGPADAYFPMDILSSFELISCEERMRSSKDSHNFAFEVYRPKNK